MPALRVCVLFLTLAVTGIRPLAAAIGSWSQIGPFGGQIHAVVFDPGSASTAYAATLGDGVFRTTDGGGTWKRASHGLPDLSVATLAIDPSRPRTLYAGTQAGLSRSTDGGGRWAPAGISRPVAQVVVAVSSPRILYALSDLSVLKRSDDGGAHWRDLAPPPETSWLSWIAVDPSTPETAYLRQLDLGRRWRLHKTTDGGTTWRRLEGFSPEAENPNPEQRFQLEVAPDRPATLLASLTFNLHSADSTLVMRSTDAGETWTRSEGAGGFPLLVLPAGRVQTDRAASRDFGETWEPRPAIGRFGTALAAHPSRPDHLLFATEAAGVWRSTDGGEAWAASSFGITAVWAYDLAVGADSTLYAGAMGSVWKSVDGGASWEDLAPTSELGSGPGFVTRVGVHPRRPRLVYAALAELDPSGGDVVRTDNGGASWTTLDSLRPLVPFGALSDFAFDPRSPGSVYAVSDWPTGSCRSFESADRGQSARCMPLGLASDVEVDPVDPRNVYAIQVEPLFERIAKSTDGGATWATSGFNRGLPNTLTFSVLAHAPGASGHLFLGTREGFVFRTTDGGRNWRPASGNLQRYGRIQGLAVDPRNPALVYAAIGLQGVFRSRDGGRRWSPIANGLPPGTLNIDVWRIPLALDPRDPATLYVGSDRRGLFAITLTD